MQDTANRHSTYVKGRTKEKDLPGSGDWCLISTTNMPPLLYVNLCNFQHFGCKFTRLKHGQ